jgi:hypothetical protein
LCAEDTAKQGERYECSKRIEKKANKNKLKGINPLTPELNPSAQRCLTIFFTGDFAS